MSGPFRFSWLFYKELKWKSERAWLHAAISSQLYWLIYGQQIFDWKVMLTAAKVTTKFVDDFTTESGLKIKVSVMLNHWESRNGSLIVLPL